MHAEVQPDGRGDTRPSPDRRLDVVITCPKPTPTPTPTATPTPKPTRHADGTAHADRAAVRLAEREPIRAAQ